MVEEHAQRLGVEPPRDTHWPNRALLQLAACRRVLMLQGPVGPFFRDLASSLLKSGVEVDKINFTGGDVRFFPSGHWFRGALDQFADHLVEHVRAARPDACLVFGQDRPVHREARRVLEELGVPVMVFEEGYVRPNFITFEVGGVNSRSSFRWPQPTDIAGDGGMGLTPQAPHFRLPFRSVASLAAQYHLLTKLGAPLYPEYQHHRPTGVLIEALAWLRSGIIKTWAPRHAEKVVQRLLSSGTPRYFLVPLQVHNDSQLQHHSGYTTIVSFIEDVLTSFARHAPSDAHLVIKHHPMNRGHRDYRGLIRSQVRLLGKDSLKRRVHYLRDGHLPTLLEHASGTVLINSTVGLSSMFHGTPVKVMGQALYDHPGLTFGGDLDDFWSNPGEVDRVQFGCFLNALIAQTQLPGSFYWPRTRYAGLLDTVEAALGAQARAGKGHMLAASPPTAAAAEPSAANQNTSPAGVAPEFANNPMSHQTA